MVEMKKLMRNRFCIRNSDKRNRGGDLRLNLGGKTQIFSKKIGFCLKNSVGLKTKNRLYNCLDIIAISERN